MKTTENNRVFWALNRNTNRVCIMHGFGTFEEVQGAFRCGIMMPDGSFANAIGRCKSIQDFIKRANHSNYTILPDPQFPYELEIEVNKSHVKVTSDIWISWTGNRYIQGIKAAGVRFYHLTTETFKPALTS
jgi:hypothetical protein